jgi:hypothetical protein
MNRASLGERSNQTRIARRRAEEEGKGHAFRPERRRSRRISSAIRAHDVRAADLQEAPTKRIETELILRDSRFVGSDEDGGSPANIGASAASHE